MEEQIDFKKLTFGAKPVKGSKLEDKLKLNDNLQKPTT